MTVATEEAGRSAARAERPLRVVVVGQTPPPYGGQAMMIKKLVEGRYPGIEVHLVRMAFSREMSDIGRLSWRKLAALPALVLRIAATRVRTGATILYYPPSNLERIGILRDVVVLLAVRWMFRRTIFHFLAAGVADTLATQPRWLRALARATYARGDLGIRASDLTPDDVNGLRLQRGIVIPHGMEDLAATPGLPPRADGTGRPRILFVALLRRSKGCLVLLEACSRLRQMQLDFDVRMVGEFASPDVEQEARRLVSEAGLVDRVQFTGVLTGEALSREYALADLFCFPSHFESEASPMVLIQAMCFGLPIVATNWRGIPALVGEAENGHLVPIRDPEALATRLAELIADPAARKRLGAAGRRRYEAHHSLVAYRAAVAAAFESVR